MTTEELEQKVKRLEEQLTEVRIELLERKVNKKPYEVEMPEDIEKYYYADEIGELYIVKDIISSRAYKEIYHLKLKKKLNNLMKNVYYCLKCTSGQRNIMEDGHLTGIIWMKKNTLLDMIIQIINLKLFIHIAIKSFLNYLIL